MKVKLANEHQNEDGTQISAWFQVPINYIEVRRVLKLDPIQPWYQVLAYELPFGIRQGTPIEYINKIAKRSGWDGKNQKLYHDLECRKSPVCD